MAFVVRWTTPAHDDLDVIARHIAVRDADAAARVRNDLLDAVEVLRQFPLLGAICESDDTGESREILCRLYRILYLVDDASQTVEIAHVRHGARSEPRFPR